MVQRFLEDLLRVASWKFEYVDWTQLDLAIDRAFEASPLYWSSGCSTRRKRRRLACGACLELIQLVDLDGVFIQEWQDPDDMGFGLVRSDETPKRAYGVVADFFERFG